MDVVYILGNGSKWFNNELKYSLRSLKNVRGEIGQIWVIGRDPGFLRSANHVPADDEFNHKCQCGLAKILTACEQPDLSENFILMNDDFYFLEPQAIKERANRDIREKLKKYRKSWPESKYTAALDCTVKLLKQAKYGWTDYDVHYPITINKEKFLELFAGIDWKNQPLLFRSVYGNAVGLKADIIKSDCKAYDMKDFKKLRNRYFVSTDNKVALGREFQDWIHGQFPEPGPYEDPDYQPPVLRDFADPADESMINAIYRPKNPFSQGIINGYIVQPGEIVQVSRDRLKRDYYPVQ